jgi:DNA invertase Pin-like site-specific DNA recombinase
MEKTPFAEQSGKRLHVVICALVSTGDQDADNQLRELRDFVTKQGWALDEEFIDVASDGRADRPQFLAMMAAAAKRKFDLVLVWSLDRLSREGTSATLRYLEQLESWGVGFRSYTEQYLDTTGMFRDVVISLLATLAKQEKVRIGERTKAGLARARASGKTLGRPGYEDSKRSEACVLRGQGKSLGQISKLLGVGRTTVLRWTTGG